MRKEEIKLAVKEAKRFIKAAELCLEARKPYRVDGVDFEFHETAPKQSGALRRASMDLTRQLAEMRKP